MLPSSLHYGSLRFQFIIEQHKRHKVKAKKKNTMRGRKKVKDAPNMRTVSFRLGPTGTAGTGHQTYGRS